MVESCLINLQKHSQRHPNRTPTFVVCLKTSSFFLNSYFAGECLIGINRFFHSILDRYSGLTALFFRTCCSQELEGKLTKDIPVKLEASEPHTATLLYWKFVLFLPLPSCENSVTGFIFCFITERSWRRWNENIPKGIPALAIIYIHIYIFLGRERFIF